MKNGGRILSGFLVTVALLAPPSAALASLRLTEIMYDPPGANAGHQWVQVSNLGSSPENLAGDKVFQNGANHGLVIVQGTTTVPAGAVAIIANNPSLFLADYPSYTGALFKAAFSLRVAGDSIVLKDAKLDVIDSAVYSSNLGASGDGNALYLSDGSWIPGMPDPSAYHASAPAAIAPAAPPSAAPKTSKSTTKTSSKSVASKSVTPDSVATSYADNDQLAAAAPSASGSSLLELVAGSAAFGVVVVAGILLSNRFNPQPQRAPAEPELLAEATRSEADEYDMVELSDEFL